MRIALFGDIHANLVALNAVLTDMMHQAPDQIVCLGDLAITGPQPHEVVERVRALGCTVVRGNWDDWALEIREGRRSPEGCRPIDIWCAEQFTAEDLQFFESFPITHEVSFPHGGSMICYHGSPRSYNEVITSMTPYEELDQLLEGRRDGILVGGHTHMTMLRRHVEALVVNPGSVSENWNFTAWPERRLFNPHAEYALVDYEAGMVSLSFRRVDIDVDAVIRAARHCGMPDVEQWTELWLSGKTAFSR